MLMLSISALEALQQRPPLLVTTSRTWPPFVPLPLLASLA